MERGRHRVHEGVDMGSTALATAAPPGVTLRFDADRRRRVAAEREAFLRGGPDAGSPRRATDRSIISSEIFNSWLRSSELGVDPSRAEVPSLVPGASRARRLSEAATPVLRAFGERSRGSEAWAMLLDRDCVQVAPTVGDEQLVRAGLARGGGVGATFREALVGTNGAGISAERLESFLVVGEEHYREAEQGLVTVGAPLRDPFGRLTGFLVMCQRVRMSNHLIVPYTQSIADAVEERLTEAVDADERALFEAFSRHSRRPSLPVLGVSEQLFVANNAAQQLARGQADGEALRATALDAVREGATRTVRVSLGGEEFRAHCRSVELSRGRFGAVVSLRRAARAAREGAPGGPAGGSGAADPGSATPADPVERAVALGLPALVTGERGCGRAHRIRLAAHPAELEAGSAEADRADWLARLRALTSSGRVLIRNIDVLHPEFRPRVLELVRASPHWVGATAAAPAPQWSETFPVNVQLEPLRERGAEFSELVRSVMRELGAAQVRVSAEAMSVLAKHPWPGNIAQLRRVLATALVAVRGDAVTVNELPREMAGSGRRPGGEGLLQRTERELIFEALQAANWNREEAALALGISRATMYRRIRQFGFQLRSSR